jgi:hypothetical protein
MMPESEREDRKLKETTGEEKNKEVIKRTAIQLPQGNGNDGSQKSSDHYPGNNSYRREW